MCLQPDAASWTCRVVGNGHLPDVAAIERTVKDVGDLFWLRGVEVVATGRVVNRRSGPSLELDQTGETVSLGPLVHKIQWSFGEQRSHPMSEDERTAYSRLVSELAKGSRRVRIVGPLVGRTVEVRSFILLPIQTAIPKSNAKP